MSKAYIGTIKIDVYVDSDDMRRIDVDHEIRNEFGTAEDVDVLRYIGALSIVQARLTGGYA